MIARLPGGAECYYEQRGQGPVLLLLHGFPLHHAMWRDQIDVLGRRLRVIAPDLRGFGKSSVTDGTVSMQRMADDVAEVLDVLGIDEPIILGGLSMGGYVALAFWKEHRHRLHALILSDTRATADPPAMVRQRRETAEMVMHEGVAPLIAGMTEKLLAASTVENHPHAVEMLKRMALANDPRGVAAASRGMAEREDFTDRLAEIKCPALLIAGESDLITPPDSMVEMCRTMPHGRFVEIPGAGHMAPMENPAEVNSAVLEFLGSL